MVSIPHRVLPGSFDVRAAVRHVQSIDPDLPIVAYGLSMSAGTAINAFGEIPEIDAMVTLSAFSSWPDMFADNMDGKYGWNPGSAGRSSATLAWAKGAIRWAGS